MSVTFRRKKTVIQIKSAHSIWQPTLCVYSGQCGRGRPLSPAASPFLSKT